MVVVASGPLPGEDYLTAQYGAGKPPPVVIVGGVRGVLGGACGVTLSAFVAGARLGNVVSPCSAADAGWETAVLSADNRLVFATGAWNTLQNAVNVSAFQQPRRIVPLAIRVMIGDKAIPAGDLADLREKVMNVALANVKPPANGVLYSTRAGIELGELDTATMNPWLVRWTRRQVKSMWRTAWPGTNSRAMTPRA